MGLPNLLSPQQAYDLAQAGKLSELKGGNISPHFTWGEVFTNCTAQEIKECPRACYDSALKQAGVMEQVRDIFKTAIIVHAWYRDALHNKRVGGAPKSQHLKAAATDFHILGLEGTAANREVQKTLDRQPFMKKCGMEYTNGPWTHVDSGRGYARFGRLT